MVQARHPSLAGRWFARPQRARTVIYDADCGICQLSCRLLARVDPFDRLRFVGDDDPAQIPDSVDRTLLHRTVVVLDTAGRVSIEERAVYEILRALPLGIVLAFWIRLPLLSGVARWLYRRIAANRMRISTWLGLEACGVPRR